MMQNELFEEIGVECQVCCCIVRGGAHRCPSCDASLKIVTVEENPIIVEVSDSNQLFLF